MRNGSPPLSGQGVIFSVVIGKTRLREIRKQADKPRWYRGNFVIEIFVLSDSLIGVVAEDFFVSINALRSSKDERHIRDLV